MDFCGSSYAHESGQERSPLDEAVESPPTTKSGLVYAYSARLPIIAAWTHVYLPGPGRTLTHSTLNAQSQEHLIAG